MNITGEPEWNETCWETDITPAPTSIFVGTTPAPTYSDELTETDVWVMFYWCLLVGCVFIIIFQILGLCYNASRLRAEGRVSYVSGHGSSNLILFTLFLTYICCGTGIGLALARLYQWPNGESCTNAFVIAYTVYVSMKAANYFFFLQRAQLAQGLTKVFKDIHFTRTIPICLLFCYILQIVFIIVFPVRGCAVRSRTAGRPICILGTDFGRPGNEKFVIMFVIQMLFDAGATAFFLYLFGKPLFKLAKKKMRGSTRNIITDRKLLRTVHINFIFTTISSVNTALTTLLFVWVEFFEWWWTADFFFNGLCMFCMFASNRRLIMHMCCFCKCKQYWRRNCKDKDNDENNDNNSNGPMSKAKHSDNSKNSKHNNNNLTSSTPASNRSTISYDSRATINNNNTGVTPTGTPNMHPSKSQKFEKRFDKKFSKYPKYKKYNSHDPPNTTNNNSNNDNTRNNTKHSPQITPLPNDAATYDLNTSQNNNNNNTTNAHTALSVTNSTNNNSSHLNNTADDNYVYQDSVELVASTSPGKESHPTPIQLSLQAAFNSTDKIALDNTNKNNNNNNNNSNNNSNTTNYTHNSVKNKGNSPKTRKSPKNLSPGNSPVAALGLNQTTSTFEDETEDGEPPEMIKRNLSTQEKALAKREIEQMRMMEHLEHGCLFYKFRLFWTWFLWMFCCPRCWVCSCPCAMSQAKKTERDKRFKTLFSAAETIQLRYYHETRTRIMLENSRLANSTATAGYQHERDSSRLGQYITSFVKRSSKQYTGKNGVIGGSSNNNNNNNNSSNNNNRNVSNISGNSNGIIIAQDSGLSTAGMGSTNDLINGDGMQMKQMARGHSSDYSQSVTVTAQTQTMTDIMDRRGNHAKGGSVSAASGVGSHVVGSPGMPGMQGMQLKSNSTKCDGTIAGALDVVVENFSDENENENEIEEDMSGNSGVGMDRLKSREKLKSVDSENEASD